MGIFGGTATARAAASPSLLDAAAGERAALLAVWAAGVLYAALFAFGLGGPAAAHGLVFNDMLARLAHGRFDISPARIGWEAFVYKGRTYAYFGIFCALLRLPLLLTGQIDLDVTRISMIAAAALSLGARLSALNLALAKAQGLSRPLRLTILAGIALGGESIQYLHPSIYQEVCSWGAALGAVFVLLAVRRIFAPAPRPARLYAGMALAAGLALLCRVSCGLGLYAALGSMLALEAWRSRSRWSGLRTLAPAALVLALFAGAAAGVNAARWDDPLAFVPLRYQQALVRYEPDRLQRLERYGELNLRRVPYALQYYFAPAWALQDGEGRMLFGETQMQLFDCVELPPSSFLLSDPAVCLLAAAGLRALARRRAGLPDAGLASAALLGLGCSAALMLVAISLTFRYRMDFYPALDFAACLGAASLSVRPAREPKRLFLYAGVLGAAVSLVSLAIYAWTPLGPAQDLDMRHGWTTPYADKLRGQSPDMGHLLPDGRRLDVSKYYG